MLNCLFSYLLGGHSNRCLPSIRPSVCLSVCLSRVCQQVTTVVPWPLDGRADSNYSVPQSAVLL